MKIKICGVSNVGDALKISESGADYVGLIFAEKSPRLVSESEARAAIEQVAPYGLDLNSAVEISPRKKNTDLISKYLKTIK